MPAFKPDLITFHRDSFSRGAFFAMGLHALTGWPVATVEAWVDADIDAPKRPYRPVRFVNIDRSGRVLDPSGRHPGSEWMVSNATGTIRDQAFAAGATRVMLGIRFFGTTLIVGADPVFGRPFAKPELVKVENAKRQIRAQKDFLADVGKWNGMGVRPSHLPYFTYGSAYAYAMALARLQGAKTNVDDVPMVSIEGNHRSTGQPWLHACVKNNQGQWLDAWGVVTLEEVVQRYDLVDVDVFEESYRTIEKQFVQEAQAVHFADYVAQEALRMTDANRHPLDEQDGKQGFLQPMGGAFLRVVFEGEQPPLFEIGAPNALDTTGRSTSENFLGGRRPDGLTGSAPPTQASSLANEEPDAS